MVVQTMSQINHQPFTNTLTLSEVESLIAATWSDNPPNPYEPLSEVMGRMNHFCWDFSELDAKEIQIWWEEPVPDYEWTPERADLLYDDVSKERYHELYNGAALTPDEQELFRKRAEGDVNWDYGWVAYIYRLEVSENSAEQRAVFFVHTTISGGQYSAPRKYAGPLRTLEEAQEVVRNDFPNTGELKMHEAI